MARKPIEPDQALLVAVSRYSGGANVHVLFWLTDCYVQACKKGFPALAQKCKQQLYRKMIQSLSPLSPTRYLLPYLKD